MKFYYKQFSIVKIQMVKICVVIPNIIAQSFKIGVWVKLVDLKADSGEF